MCLCCLVFLLNSILWQSYLRAAYCLSIRMYSCILIFSVYEFICIVFVFMCKFIYSSPVSHQAAPGNLEGQCSHLSSMIIPFPPMVCPSRHQKPSGSFMSWQRQEKNRKTWIQGTVHSNLEPQVCNSILFWS